jgi:hypothetical protein
MIGLEGARPSPGSFWLRVTAAQPWTTTAGSNRVRGIDGLQVVPFNDLGRWICGGSQPTLSATLATCRVNGLLTSITFLDPSFFIGNPLQAAAQSTKLAADSSEGSVKLTGNYVDSGCLDYSRRLGNRPNGRRASSLHSRTAEWHDSALELDAFRQFRNCRDQRGRADRLAKVNLYCAAKHALKASDTLTVGRSD